MSDTVLILNNQQIAGLITPGEALGAIEIAFRELGEGKTKFMPRHIIGLPKEIQPNLDYVFNIHAGAVTAFHTMALRIDSRTTAVRQVGGMMRQDHPGDEVGLVLLFDMNDNLLKAILHDYYLSPIRVGATSAMVAKYLALQDVSVMGLFGSGNQAKAHAAAMCGIRPIRLIKVYSPTRTHREAFAKEMTSKLGVEVQAMNEPHQVVEGAKIVVVATNSNELVLRAEWLEKGTHVVTIRSSNGHRAQWETDEKTICRADIIILNYKEPVRTEGQLGFLPLLEQGILQWDCLYEVADLAVGRCPKRSDSQQITVHYNNIGMGIQFAAVGALIYQKAKERGVGTKIPAELFITRKGKII